MTTIKQIKEKREQVRVLAIELQKLRNQHTEASTKAAIYYDNWRELDRTYRNELASLREMGANWAQDDGENAVQEEINLPEAYS
jgi:hypothetical protein